ncbi:MAG TPA: hypothetical protein V6D03_15125, partial [Candidatus Caenarcaniphilales bacterium]
QLKPTPGLSQNNYQLIVSLSNPAPPSPTPIPSPSPTSSPEPSPPPVEVEVEQVRFADGQAGQWVGGTINPNQVKRYLVNARAGQILAAQVIDGAVTLNIRTPNGELVENAAKVLDWESELPVSGEYQIDVVALEQTDFSLNITVRDLQ